MSTQARIRCINCDSTYYVYWTGISRENIVHCPHCDARIEEKMWERVIDAMGAVHNVNYHFLKYKGEYNEDLFEVSVEHIQVPLEKFRNLYSD